jgi:hypothetical protein
MFFAPIQSCLAPNPIAWSELEFSFLNFRRLLGVTDADRAVSYARAAETFRHKAGRVEFVPACNRWPWVGWIAAYPEA